MAFRKKPEIDWSILDDDFEEISEKEVEKEPKPNKKGKPQSKKQKTKKDKAKDYDDDESYSSSSYSGYSSYDSIEYEDKPSHVFPLVKIVISVLVLIIGLGCLGYINTDFDNDGNPYIVPLELHYERKYINESDKLLDYIMDVSNSLEKNTENLPYEFMQISTELKNGKSKMASLTTNLSKYVGVPTSVDTYHTALLNFSIKSQNFIQTLIDNYNDADYEAFREAGLSDYFTEFNQVKSLRSQIDATLFRNMEQGE